MMVSPSPPQLTPEQLAALQREDNGPLLITVVSIFTAIGCIFVCLRVYARFIIKHNHGPEDYCIILSLAHTITMAILQIEGARNGGAKHMMLLPLPLIERLLKYLFGSMLMYAIALTLTKLAILLQYHRIFTFTSMRIPIYIVGAICLAVGISAVFVVVFSCIPVSAFWDISEKQTAKCIDANAFGFAGTALNIITDILVAALPVRAIWQLQVPRPHRIALMCILTLGWCVCVISFARLHGFVELTKHPEDPTFYGASVAYWSAIEVNLGIVCACAPALKPVVAKIIPGFSSRYGSHTSAHGGTGDTPKGFSSFVELKGKSSIGTLSNEVELRYSSGDEPSSKSCKGLPSSIHVKTDLEQQIDDVDGDIDTESERYLVTRPARVMDRL